MADGAARVRPVLVRMLEGRVGSTYLMKLLGTSAEVAFDRVHPYEHSYLTYLSRLLHQLTLTPGPGEELIDLLYGEDRRIGPLPFTPPAGYDGAAAARAGLQAVWESLSAPWAVAGATVYAEKFWGPVPPLIEAGLDPVVVDLVRDPRDVVASIRAFNAKTGVARFGRAAVSDDRQHLRRLVIGMGWRLQELSEPLACAHTCVRYEDLVADPAGVAGRLGKLIGVRLDPGLADDGSEASRRHMTAPSAARSIGRHATDLNPEERALIERRLGARMHDLGYR